MTENPLDKMRAHGDAKNGVANLDVFEKLQDNDWSNDPTPHGVGSSLEPLTCEQLLREITGLLRQRFGNVPIQVTQKLESINGSAKLNELLESLKICRSIDEFEAGLP